MFKKTLLSNAEEPETILRTRRKIAKSAPRYGKHL
jgi:hypothetical protein